jgi:hypothetical protein
MPPKPSVEGRPITLEPGAVPLPSGDGEGDPVGDTESPAAATNAAKWPAFVEPFSPLTEFAGRALLALEMTGDLWGNWNAKGLNGFGTLPAALWKARTSLSAEEEWPAKSGCCPCHGLGEGCGRHACCPCGDSGDRAEVGGAADGCIGIEG